MNDMAQCVDCFRWMIVLPEERLLIKIFGNGPFCKVCKDKWNEDDQ